MIRKLIFCTLLCVSTAVFAQIPDNLLSVTQEVTQYDEYEGSIYLNRKFSDSDFIDESSGTYSAPLRYNIFRDAIEFKDEDGLYALTLNEKVHVRIGQDFFYYCDFNDQRGRLVDGYFVLVEFNDQYSIYKKYEVRIKDPIKMDVHNGSPEPGEIRRKVTYFLEQNNVIMELPIDKKKILAALSGQADELKKYMKSEKIRLKKEEDLLKLVAKYNSLIHIDGKPNSMLTGGE